MEKEEKEGPFFFLDPGRGELVEIPRQTIAAKFIIESPS